MINIRQRIDELLSKTTTSKERIQIKKELEEEIQYINYISLYSDLSYAKIKPIIIEIIDQEIAKYFSDNSFLNSLTSSPKENANRIGELREQIICDLDIAIKERQKDLASALRNGTRYQNTLEEEVIKKTISTILVGLKYTFDHSFSLILTAELESAATEFLQSNQAENDKQTILTKLSSSIKEQFIEITRGSLDSSKELGLEIVRETDIKDKRAKIAALKSSLQASEVKTSNKDAKYKIAILILILVLMASLSSSIKNLSNKSEGKENSKSNSYTTEETYEPKDYPVESTNSSINELENYSKTLN